MNNNHPSREKGPAPPVQPKEKAGPEHTRATRNRHNHQHAGHAIGQHAAAP